MSGSKRRAREKQDTPETLAVELDRARGESALYGVAYLLLQLCRRQATDIEERQPKREIVSP